VTVHVTPRQLSYWSDNSQRWVLDGGGRTVYVGDADAPSDLPLQATLPSTKPGAISCADTQFSATTIDGSLNVPAGAWCDLERVTVNGNVVVGSTSGVRIEGSTVNGNFTVKGAAPASDPLSAGLDVICNDTITGNLTVSGSAAAAPWNIGLCSGNTVNGNLDFDDNAATSNSISGNTIGKNLSCSGNGGVSGGGNKVSGNATGQCAGLKT
jgi:hypothetical protein